MRLAKRSKEGRHEGLALGRVIRKPPEVPAVVRPRARHEVGHCPCRERQPGRVPRQQRPADPPDDFAEVVRAGNPAEQAAVRDGVVIGILPAQSQQPIAGIHVDRQAKAKNHAPRGEPPVAKPGGTVDGRVDKQPGALQRAVDEIDRKVYRSALVDYLSQFKSELDADSQRRLESNPLRILDSKDPGTRKILEQAPSLDDYLDEESREHFERLKALLDAAGVRYAVNPALVRGLDYYGKTVFEWITDSLGAQGTVCAGGRYDGLVEQLGGKPTVAVGFAMGLERLILLLETLELIPDEVNSNADVYVTAMGEGALAPALVLSEQLRAELPGRVIVCHCGGGSFKSQMKKADRSGARYAVILGENEVASQTVGLKPLRADEPQSEVAQAELASVLADALGG